MKKRTSSKTATGTELKMVVELTDEELEAVAAGTGVIVNRPTPPPAAPNTGTNFVYEEIIW